MSVEEVPMRDLHEELKGIVPGSPDERQVLERARQRTEEKTDEFRVIRNAHMEEAASEHGVVRGTQAQHAAQVAIEQVTGEHQVPAAGSDIPHALR